MKIRKIGIIVIGLVPFNVYAECTPTPDCASIGYTETSCEGASLKCPFDITKMMCMPCDSSFRYDCSGDNITGGTGSACGGKYVSCECDTEGYVFNNGFCICPTIIESDCLVGAIYYPDGKCSNDYVACLNPVGVVVKDNELVMSWQSTSTMQWGTDTNINTLTNITSNYTLKTDYNGADNTAKIVAFQTEEGLTSSNSAAIYCNEYAPTGMESSKGRWYLPAFGELYKYVYGNYNTLLNIYTTHLESDKFVRWFWSSSEYSSSNAWAISVESGDTYVDGNEKYRAYWVSCFLAL